MFPVFQEKNKNSNFLNLIIIDIYNPSAFLGPPC